MFALGVASRRRGGSSRKGGFTDVESLRKEVPEFADVPDTEAQAFVDANMMQRAAVRPDIREKFFSEEKKYPTEPSSGLVSKSTAVQTDAAQAYDHEKERLRQQAKAEETERKKLESELYSARVSKNNAELALEEERLRRLYGDNWRWHIPTRLLPYFSFDEYNIKERIKRDVKDELEEERRRKARERQSNKPKPKPKSKARSKSPKSKPKAKTKPKSKK